MTSVGETGRPCRRCRSSRPSSSPGSPRVRLGWRRTVLRFTPGLRRRLHPNPRRTSCYWAPRPSRKPPRSHGRNRTGRRMQHRGRKMRASRDHRRAACWMLYNPLLRRAHVNTSCGGRSHGTGVAPPATLPPARERITSRQQAPSESRRRRQSPGGALNSASKRSGSKRWRPFGCSANARSPEMWRFAAAATCLCLGLIGSPAGAGDLTSAEPNQPLETLQAAEPSSGSPSSSAVVPPTASGATAPSESSLSGTGWINLDNFSASVGASAWSGDFGSSSTTTISAELLSGTYRVGDLRLSATLPYTRISTAGNVFLGLGATPLIVRSQTTASKRVNEGVGDLTLNASYVLHSNANIDVQLLGGLKAPTASASSRVSTGEADVSFGAEISRPFGRFVPFASIVYRDFGNSLQIRLRDGAATSVGASYVVASRWVANFSYDYSRSASRFVADSHELVSSASYKFMRTGVRLSAYVSAGLSSGAPAISGGLSLGKAF